MDLYDYFKGLEPKQREAYAKRVKTSLIYLRNHVMKPRPKPIKGASVGYMQRLADSSQGKVSFAEAASHFSDRDIYSGTPQNVQPQG